MDNTGLAVLLLILAAMILAVIAGLLIAHLIIKTGLCGHPQCQPPAKNPAGDFPHINREYTLMAERGPISDRLRKQFPADAPEWNPPRDETEPEAKPLPKGRDGWGITGRNKK